MLARAVLLLLLLMNLGVAAWWWLRTPPATVSAAGGEPGVPSLKLLSEVDAAADGSSPTLAANADLALGQNSGLVCQQIGPFLTQADMRRAMKSLTPLVSQIQYRETRALANRGFWVFLPAQGTREAALASARELSASGVRDYYVVTAGDQENTSSLGLFRALGNAESRRDQVVALGFTPELQTRTEEIPNYWIELAAKESPDWSESLKGFAGVESSPIDCG
jgi:hypothetical protein